jgi:DNA-binding NarL/FixJ family response regulator
MKTLNALQRMNDVAVNDSLSERETEVLELVAIGMSNREIAHAMSVSEKTVKQHVVNIYQKTNLSRDDGGNPRVLLALYAIRAGLVAPA